MLRLSWDSNPRSSIGKRDSQELIPFRYLLQVTPVGFCNATAASKNVSCSLRLRMHVFYVEQYAFPVRNRMTTVQFSTIFYLFIVLQF